MRAKAELSAIATWVATASLGMTVRAYAQVTIPACNDLIGRSALPADAGSPTSPLYVAGPADAQGSSGAEATIEAVAGILGMASPIVYVPVASCVALQDVTSGAPGAAFANYVASSSSLTPCTASDVIPDMAISDVYPDTCSPGMLTPAQADLLGPVDVTTFVVPAASTENSISSDAAYVVFGFGGYGYGVKPWIDPNSIFTPATTSGPLNLAGVALGLAASKWANPTVSLTPLSAEVKAVSGGKTNAAIGILPLATARASPTAVKVLAYQHSGEDCGYLPDSDPLHGDRINVRQGRYALWGPLHFVVNVDPSGSPLDHNGQPNATLGAIAALLAATGPTASGSLAPTGNAPEAANETKVALVLAEAAAGLVPWCAMQVIRAGEIGAEASYAPTEPCGCAFESSVGAPIGALRCATCQTDTDCVTATPHCRYGYCEGQ